MTDDRIREIYKDDDLKDLERLYYEVDAEVEKRKGRRVILLGLGFFIAYLILFLVIDQPGSFAAVAGTFLVALFLSPVHTYIHILIFSQFIHKQHEENDRRELIQKRIQFAKERAARQTPYDLGYAAGYKEGHHSGYLKGNDEGRDFGYDMGCDLGHAKGYDEGYDKGYDKGYSKGYHDARIDLDNGVYEDDYDGDDDDDDDDSFLDRLLSDVN